MAKCEYCNQDMLKCDGCTKSTIILSDGKKYKRIKMGDDEDFYCGFTDKNEKCHDCGASIGHYHHFGCDCERCPKCHFQLISCDC